MFREFAKLSQEKTGFRRLFMDGVFELYLWYDAPGGNLIGFQLCYDLGQGPYAFTRRSSGQCDNSRIDDGESPFSYNQSPILAQGGQGDGILAELSMRFEAASQGLDQELRAYVLESIKDCGAAERIPLGPTGQLWA